MSSSFPEGAAHALRASAAALAVAASWVSVADAADTYFIPKLTAGGEYDTNRVMATTGAKQGLTGYVGTAEAIFGARTPRSSTELRPFVRYQDYPSNTRLNRTEGSLDLKNNFLTRRTEFNLLANYSQLDLFTAEFVEAGFDPFNPDPAGDGGQAVLTETRKRVDVHPTFLYRWSETMGIGTELEYEDARYSADVPLARQDYDNWQANLYLQRRFTPRTTVNAGGYVGRFQTQSGADIADSVAGLSFNVTHDWTKQNQSELALTVERDTVDVHMPGVADDSTTDVGVEFSTQRRGEVSQLRLAVGRDIAPTGEGGRALRDQIRGQYDRNLSARLSFTGLLRAYRQRAVLNLAANSETWREVVASELSMQWMVTPTWSFRGGYGYNWQDRSNTTGSADNNRIFLEFGYQARDPRLRR